MSTFNLSLNHHLDLPDDVFRLMREQIYKRTGMWFSDTSKYLLQKRLSPRARELNFDSFQKYFYFLQYDPRAEAGYLLLGHSESLISLSTQFKLRHLKNDMVYQK